MAAKEKVDACRICGSTEGQPIMTVRSTHTSTWVVCGGCGLQRLQPYPAPEVLAAYYNDSYREKDDFAAVGLSVSHRVRYSADYEHRLHEEYALSLADVGISVGGGMRVLDYGCADGGFLGFLAGREIESENLYGVDISPQMVDVVRKKGFNAYTLADQDQLLGEMFDLITLWDVIEHVPDPLATLRWLRPRLAENGRLLMQTPRIGLLSDALGDRFEHYLPLEHLHLFSREALCEASRRAGFTVERCASFGANAPAERIAMPYKLAFDRLAKASDQGATQLAVLS